MRNGGISYPLRGWKRLAGEMLTLTSKSRPVRCFRRVKSPSVFSSDRAHILEVERVVVDAAVGRRDPVRKFSRCIHADHESARIGPVALTGKRTRDDVCGASIAIGIHARASPKTDI